MNYSLRQYQLNKVAEARAMMGRGQGDVQEFAVSEAE